VIAATAFKEGRVARWGGPLLLTETTANTSASHT
jgi:hypothetical protein